MEPKVLLVEDGEDQQAKWQAALAEHAPLSATNARDGIRLFNEHKASLKAIVLDGALAQSTMGIQVLQHVMKTEFAGALIAASGERSLQNDLQCYGCTYAAHTKDEVPVIVEEALKDIATLDGLGDEAVKSMRAYFAKKVDGAKWSQSLLKDLEKAMRKGALTPSRILTFDRIVPDISVLIEDRTLGDRVYRETGKEDVCDIIEFLVKEEELKIA
jgi:DNA-binding NtrC family response regulator